MTKAEKISHLSDVTRAAIDSLQVAMKGRYGYLDRLHDLADSGAYITPNTTEAIRWHTDALILRDLADEIMKCRAALIANEQRQLETSDV